MCGIVGFLADRGADKLISKEALVRMTTLLHHRGPDQTSTHWEQSVGLGNRRLSIIDLDGGVQPYTHEPSGVIVVFNGEIYNCPELREELIAGGVSLTERSEVEMICELYLKHGVESLQKFNGMWAIALYDPRERLLFLSRDRLGMKPLYYGFHGRHLVFGSEIKCVLAAPDFPRDIDHQLMKASIYTGFINEPLTPFKHVRALLPGQYAVVADHDLETFKCHTYWSLPHVTDAPTAKKKSVDTLEQELGELLEDSVKLRLRSDVPVAAFLSGGIDSSAILHYLKQIMKTHITAYSINFKREESEFDELTFQHEVAHHLGIENRRYYFEDRLAEIRDSLEKGMWFAEFPDIGFEQDILFLHLANLVKGDGFKVALSGEGADELLRGYEHYLYFPYFLRYAESFDLEEFNGMADLDLDDDELGEFAECEGDFLRKFGYPAALLGGPQSWWHLLEERKFKKLDKQIFKTKDPFRNCFGSTPFTDDFAGLENHYLQVMDIRHRLPNYILRTTDRFSKAASLEVRCPFMDHRLFEWFFNLTHGRRESPKREKYLLKRLMKGKLPPSVVNREKQGFGAPYLMSTMDGHPELLDQLLSKKALKGAGLFSHRFVHEHLHLLDENVAETDEELNLRDMMNNVVPVQLFYHTYQDNFDSYVEDHLASSRPLSDE